MTLCVHAALPTLFLATCRVLVVFRAIFLATMSAMKGFLAGVVAMLGAYGLLIFL